MLEGISSLVSGGAGSLRLMSIPCTFVSRCAHSEALPTAPPRCSSLPWKHSPPPLFLTTNGTSFLLVSACMVVFDAAPVFAVFFQVLPNGPAQESASAVLQIVLTQREGESQDQYRQGFRTGRGGRSPTETLTRACLTT